ncbi:cell wall-binding repeat-containing protein, partial [Microvirga sp. 3-52]|nr:cell wall-binding repeat-containing protein [Microvirga sp. 3-52]
KNGLPILLTQATKLPKATTDKMAELNTSKTIIVGGQTVVSNKVAAQLPQVTRLAGKDRYETNNQVANYFGGQGKNVYIATGKGYADALTGAVLAAKNDSAVLLVHDRIPEVVTDYLTENATKRLTILGGESAVSKKVENDLKKLLQ